MDADFTRLITKNRLTSENIQKIYNTVSEYSAEADPNGLLANRCATAALFFAAQIPLSEDETFLRRDLQDFLQQETGLPEKEADVLCTMLCSILAVAFPVFTGPEEPSAAQQPQACFSLNPACRDQVAQYRILASLPLS